MVRDRPLALSAVFAGAAVLLAAAPTRLSADDRVTLRVDDARGRPGGLVEVVVRTYEPRGVGQGQICLGAGAPSGVSSLGVALEDRAAAAVSAKQDGVAKQATSPGPLLSLEGFVVESGADDAVAEATFDELSQRVGLTFEAPSGTINQSDGPLAVFYFRIAPTAVPGVQLELGLDGGTSLVDPGGETLELELRAGRLEILELGDPARLEVAGDRIPPGDAARLAVETVGGLALASGQLVLRYEPGIAGGPPAVTVAAYHGQASFAIDDSTPGWLAVSFTSPDASLSWPQGEMVVVELPISEGAAYGHESPVWLDPETTFLVDPEAVFLPVELEGDVIELRD